MTCATSPNFAGESLAIVYSSESGADAWVHVPAGHTSLASLVSAVKHALQGSLPGEVRICLARRDAVPATQHPFGGVHELACGRMAAWQLVPS